MKRSTLVPLLAALFCVAAPTTNAQFVGYVNRAFVAGENWFVNPLADPPNSLSQIFPGTSTPAGTAVSMWNPGTVSFGAPSILQAGAWSVDFVLDPGIGLRLTAPAAFTNTFVGTVLAPDGNPLLDPDSVMPPPPFPGPDGVYLLGSKFPAQLSDGAGTRGPVFEYVIGRGPREGEQFLWLNEATQTYQLTTFTGGLWDNGAPTLGVAQSALFNLGPIPEPATATLLVLSLASLWLGRRPQTG